MRRPASDRYNAVFERLVTSPDDIEGFIAYGLYKQAKREWLVNQKARTGRLPSTQELDAYNAYWTDTALQSLRENAESALSAYADAVVTAASPAIEASALKQGRPVWKDLMIGAVSAFTYSILLIVASYLIQVFGNDIADAYRSVTSRG